MPELFRDPAQPVAARVDDLLARMTLREKVGQLNQRLLGWTAWTRDGGGVTTTDALEAEAERWGGIGAIYGLLRADAWSGRDWATGAAPDESAGVAALVQERVVKASRFAIPALFVEESPHGHQALGSQLYPTNIGVAATWQPDLLEEAAAHVGAELRARGAHLTLVAGLDMLRDPRWGRAEECFGEDPLLASLFTRALVRGMQRTPGLGVVLKHLAGQGAGIGGRNSSGTPIGPRELAEIHLPAARAGVDAGAVGLMAAYNDLDGVPCTANEHLLTGLLRDEWGFDGIVMADMFSIDRLLRSAPSEAAPSTARSARAAAGAIALRAGVDMSMCDLAYVALVDAVDAGLVTESLVDRACRRVLAVKIRLGLLDPPLPAPSFPPPSPAEDLVASTAVLLTNRGGLLPLAAPPVRVAVLGPNADDLAALLGDYVPPLPPGVGVTVLDAVRARIGAGARHERGCDHTAPIDGGCARAAALAADSDLAILVLGSTSSRGYDDDFEANGAAALGGTRMKPVATSGEGFDAAEVELPAAQRALVAAVTAAVSAAGTPTVAVIVSGRPHGVGSVAAACDAVVYAWYPGPTGGDAIADLVLGDREPVGRLPVSLPRSSAVLPVAYNERLEWTVRYVDTEAAAEFPFGAGLGYTTWALGEAVDASAYGGDAAPYGRLENAALAATLSNTGSRSGSTVVQLYARVRKPGILPRKAVLAGFTRVTLDAGAGEQVRVGIAVDALPALGLAPGDPATVDLWLSLDGPGEPTTPVSLAWPATGQAVTGGPLGRAEH